MSLYLHSKKSKKKAIEEPEMSLTPGREVSGLVKSNPLLAASRHFESDTNSGLTESDLGDDLPASDGEQGFENVSGIAFQLQLGRVCFKYEPGRRGYCNLERRKGLRSTGVRSFCSL